MSKNTEKLDRCSYRKAIYSGTFDPITKGHLDIIKRAAMIFDEVIIAVAKSERKGPMFSHEDRVKFAQAATASIENVRVEGFDTLLVDFATEQNINTIIRGLRAVSDFDFEFQAALMNRKLDDSVETVFIMTRGKYCYLSSSVVKEVASLGGDLDGLIPENVKVKLVEKFK